MKIDYLKMKKNNSYLEGYIDCVDESLKELPFEYKTRLSKSFYAINSKEMDKINGQKFFVSKKIDGHLQLVVFNGEQIFMIGRRGIVRAYIPCLEEAKKLFIDKQITSIIAGAELYVQKKDERCRVYDVIAALSDDNSLNTLGLAFFDILEINGKSMKTEKYENIFNRLLEILPKTGKAIIIETKIAKSKAEVKELFNKWVNEEGCEGLVVRSDMPFMYKIKPKHTFDAIIVGYVEGINEHKGKVKNMLFAFMVEPGIYQVVGKAGNSLTEDQRKEFFDLLSQKHVDSTFIETDNEGVAFHIVKPEIVIEVGCNDIMTENTYGYPLLNPLIKFDENHFFLYHTTPGVRFIYPMVERIREDKSNSFQDIRFSQISDIIFLQETSLSPETLPQSKILLRKVYQKTSKNKIMLQKFLVWKSNKEDINPRYPAYVMHYTNFSSQRKDPLQREIFISNSQDQIMKITDQFIQENIKKGWLLSEL